MKEYEVPVVYRGQVNYVVKAGSPQEAEAAARLRYSTGDSGDVLGNEWEEIEKVGEVKEKD
jgi:hypothetical protein